MFEFSPSQKKYVKVALSQGIRTDGRMPSQRRPAQIKCNVLDNLAGSSYISIDHGKCQIYTGIKLKITTAVEGEQLTPRIFVQLSSMRKLTKEQTNILTYLQQLLELHYINKETKGFKELTIPNAKRHYFQLHIETFILSEPHLSLIEPIYLAVRKALASTSVPKLDCFFNQITNEETVQLTNENQVLSVGIVDTLVLVGLLQGNLILDLTPLEFQSVESALLLTVRGQKVQSVQSLKGSISTEQMHKICRFAINSVK